jgi:PAS domain S-box-containing protein
MPGAPISHDLLFRLLADASVEFIGMCDAEFKPFYVNSAGQRLVGLPSLEAARAAQVQDFFFAEDQAYITDEFFPRVLAEGAGEVEIRFRHFVTGEAIWMLYNVFVLRDAAGAAVGYATVSRDIHRRKLAEAALREREHQLALFVEQAPTSIAMFDREMRYVATSRRWLSDHGIPADDVLGKNIHETLPDIPERWRAIHQRGLAGEVARAEQDRLDRADGSVLWLRWEVRPWRDAGGAVGGILIFSEDITARKRAEDTLREREQLLALFIEHAPVSIAMFDRDMRYLAASRHWLSAPEYDGRELIGKTMYEVLPDVPERWREVHRRCLAGAVEIAEEDRFERADGSVLWLRWELRPWHDAKGDVGGLVVFAEDITARKLAEDAIREREEQLAAFIEQAPVSIAMLDRDMRYVAASRGWLAHYRLGERELGGLSHYEVFPEIPARWREVHRRCLAGAEERADEDAFVRADGSVEWQRWAIRPWRDARGAIGGIVIFSEDITARKQAEDALHAREQQLALFIEHAPASIAMFDREMRYLAASRRWSSNYGLDERDLRGLHHYDVIPDIPERWREVHRRCLAGAIERSDEDRFERADGSAQWLRWEIHPWRDARGAIGGIVIFSEDITARKLAEEYHARLETELRQAQKLESLGVMAGGIAHQFNNLLTAVLGNCELAQLQLPRTSPTRTYVEDAMAAAQRVSELTAQLLAYAGKGRFAVEEVDLSKLVEGMRARVAVSVPASCVVRYDLAPGLPKVLADRTQIQQVVMNLVLNAAEALGDRPGSITIRTGVVERDAIVVPDEFGRRRLPAGEYVFGEIADTGCGIPDDSKARLFDPFFTTKFLGRGLGLPAVFGIVRSHQGMIEVESAVGRGTTVRFLLPVSG